MDLYGRANKYIVNKVDVISSIKKIKDHLEEEIEDRGDRVRIRRDN